jgi:two-component system, OmpR family, sensor histidine kinase KdpD
MKRIEYVLFLGLRDGQRGKRYVLDALLALVLPTIVTYIIFIARLYPAVPNISFLYLLIVLGLATIRGLYAAVVASVVAFLTFDFFLVPPFYTLTVGKYEEWLALFIFLVTSIITGELASALRQRAEVATQREKETRALYDLVNATTNEPQLASQLHTIAQAIVSNFSAEGVRDCSILLPDIHGTGKLDMLADAQQDATQLQLSVDEMRTAESVMMEGSIVSFFVDADNNLPYRFRRIINEKPLKSGSIRFVPLHQNHRVVGVVRLVMMDGLQRFPIERAQINTSTDINHRAAFFWIFLDQAAAMIERARLHSEAVQIELLRRTDALRASLLSSVSHDLRTPLASIKAAASSLLQNDIEWDEEAKNSFAQAIEREADRLNRLVGNILDMSRIEGGALKAEKELYPLDALLHDVLGHMQAVLQGREVKLDIPDNLPPVPLDYLQIDQVVTNLLENAIRYTAPPSPIEITVQVVDDHIMVTIGDHGPGIPPYDLERIFDKFYRVSGAKRKATSVMGTGLGLAVCRGLVEAHGGRIWAENRAGGGALFRFTLPLDKLEGQV